MRDEKKFFAGEDADLDDTSEYVLNLYPLEERPFSQGWGRAIGFDPRYRYYFHEDRSGSGVTAAGHRMSPSSRKNSTRWHQVMPFSWRLW